MDQYFHSAAVKFSGTSAVFYVCIFTCSQMPILLLKIYSILQVL